jgi:putative sigma-54 modulation protein
VVRAKVAAADQFAAVDAAVAKLEQQLHKLKTRMIARSHGKLHAASKGPTRQEGDAGEAVVDQAVTGSRLVKVKRITVKPMTVDEAILQMDLLGHSFFFFETADTGASAVIYRRTDGDIGMIEAEP